MLKVSHKVLPGVAHSEYKLSVGEGRILSLLGRCVHPTNSALRYHSNSYPLEAASSAIPKSWTHTYSFIPSVTSNSRPRQARLDTELNPSILNNSLPDDALHTQTEPSFPLVINFDASYRFCAMQVTGPSCEGENKCALRFIRCVESRGQCSIRMRDGVFCDKISLFRYYTQQINMWCKKPEYINT